VLHNISPKYFVSELPRIVEAIPDWGIFGKLSTLSGAGFFLRESSFGTRVKTGEESEKRQSS
jgi:hypothetical protein